MRGMEPRTLLAAVIALAPVLAMGQEKKPEEKTPPATGAPAPTTPPPEEEAPLPDDFKVNDDPNNPDAVTTQEDPVVEAKVVVKARPTKETYPIEAIQRPLTLTQEPCRASGAAA